MPAEKHPSYREELQRCNYTLEYVEKSLEFTSRKKEKIDSDVEWKKKHFNSDSSQDYIDLMVNTTLQGSLSLKLRNLLAARSKPYFARVDFKEGGKSTAENLYIGKMSLMRDEDQEVIIVDWRTPVANLYYEGRLGEESYVCPDGDMNGELLLKRQFSINEGRLDEIFDIDITTNDEFLQKYLGANADNRLKEIVSTIQVEQNKIVRADMWNPLIVQGAAGSGKTTIALHRIAYLVYTYEKSFEPENFMIIAPNRLFLNYISEVLPELGVDRVKQTTFEEFAMELIGKRFKIKDGFEKLIAFVSLEASSDIEKRNELVKKASELKASIIYKQAIDNYIKLIEDEFIPCEDFVFASKTIFKHDEIKRLFLNEYKYLPVAKRLNEIKKHLSNRLKLSKESIINQLHDQCDIRVRQLKENMQDCEERQKLIIEAIDKKNDTIGKLESLSKKAVNEYISKISRLDPFKYYKDFIEDEMIFCKAFSEAACMEVLKFTREYTRSVLASGYIDLEDLAPIIYLKYCIYGMDEKIPVRHIVIDEAQDFNVFQFYVLRKIVKDSSFTILGDLAQGIHSYRGIKDWDELKEQVFDDRRSQVLTLEKSYRTTIEIMEAANKVISKLSIKNLAPAKPVIRHGEEVVTLAKGSKKEIAADIGERIRDLKDNGLKTAAIICKTMDECKAMLLLLKKQVDENIFIITGKEAEYRSGIVIVPCYLAKGLEFDAVMVADAGADFYKEDELDVKLLYVALTRAMHRLYVYYTGELTPLLV